MANTKGLIFISLKKNYKTILKYNNLFFQKFFIFFNSYYAH